MSASRPRTTPQPDRSRTLTVATKVSEAENTALLAAVKAGRAASRSGYVADALAAALVRDGLLEPRVDGAAAPAAPVVEACPHVKTTFRGYGAFCDACGARVR